MVTLTLEDIIDRARRLPETARLAFLQEVCGGDEALCDEILQWVASGHATAPPSDPASLDSYRRVDHIGPWRVLRSLGRGGMGEVFLAERADGQFRQQVAVKVVAPGRVSPQVLGRLRIEREILATLVHPNIARLLDGGTLADGSPYIVMEYVDGEPIDVYCDRRCLDLVARIELFRTVCAAVQCAHQNLVVHRDLKPSNILVMADGTPKLLDFGIAKLLDARLALHTLAVTHADFRMLTPDHASPEQVRGEPVTTSSDIYVLGVLLYELLTGCRPVEFVAATFTGIERAICEEAFTSPSARFASLVRTNPELAARLAACRSLTSTRLQRRLQGDLDNIVARAMRKEPQRRYTSAEQLAEDLARHRNGEPVIARPDTRWYRLRKFVGRHRVAVAMGVTIAALLATCVVLAWASALRIARERDIATAERTRAEEVSTFLIELFESSDPMQADRTDVTARELLDAAARRITSGLGDQPETRILLLGTIGRIYGNLGIDQRAIELLDESVRLAERQFGPRDLRLAAALRAHGDSLTAAGRYDFANQRLDAALAVAVAAAGPDSPDAAATHHSLGRLLQQRGDLRTAERHYRRAVAIHASLRATQTAAYASLLNDLAATLTHRAAYPEAEALYREALEIDLHLLGAEHPQVAQHEHSLAVVLQLEGRLEEAAPLFRRSVNLLARVLGEDHPQTIDALGNYGRYLQARGEAAQAETLLRQVLDRNIATRGAGHPYVGYDHVNLGLLLHELGRSREAEQHLRKALEIYTRTLPPDHLYVASAQVALGRVLTGQGRRAEARAAIENGLAILQARVPAGHPQWIAARRALADAEDP